MDELFSRFARENDGESQEEEQQAELEAPAAAAAAPAAAAAAAAPAARGRALRGQHARPAPGLPRAPGQPEQVFDLRPDLEGDIRFNARGFMRAHCFCQAHKTGGRPCTRQRQTTAGRAGAGRPIGSLVAWLRQASRHGTQLEHVASAPASFEERASARAWFEALPNGSWLLSKERERFLDRDEGPEPESLP